MVTGIKTPHDLLFKRSFGIDVVAQDFLQATLPQHILAQMDLTTLTPCGETLVDEQLKQHIVDLVYTVNGKQP